MTDRKDLKQGDVVYTSGGIKCQFIAHLDTGRFAVRPWEDYDNGIEDSWAGWGEPKAVSAIYCVPPTHILEKEIEQAEFTLKMLKTEIFKEETQLRLVRATQERQLKEIVDYGPVVARIKDFVEGKVTHFVRDDYGDLSIHTFQEMLKVEDSDRRHDTHTQRLLSLFGKTNGDFFWKINRWSDGSGRSETVIPCTSEEEAKQVLANIIQEGIKNLDAQLNGARKLLKAADTYGLPFPEKIREQVHAKDVESAKKEVTKAQHVLTEVKKKLADLGEPIQTLIID